MKHYFKKLILFAVPLTFLAFCLVTGKAKFVCDGESLTAYGFPLLWMMSGATSLSTAADLTAFIIDLGAYFSIFAAVSATDFFDNIFGRKKSLISILLWSVVFFVGGFFILTLSFDLYSQKIIPFSCEQKQHIPHFGFPFGR